MSRYRIFLPFSRLFLIFVLLPLIGVGVCPFMLLCQRSSALLPMCGMILPRPCISIVLQFSRLWCIWLAQIAFFSPAIMVCCVSIVLLSILDDLGWMKRQSR